MLAGLAAALLIGGIGFFAWESLDDRDGGHDEDESNTAVEATTGARIALEDALRIATSQVPGEVVKVEREREDGIEVIEIKVLAANGRVRELKLDARDGRVLEIEGD
jgi:uncharacterized membrane protein YkoI